MLAQTDITPILAAAVSGLVLVLTSVISVLVVGGRREMSTGDKNGSLGKVAAETMHKVDKIDRLIRVHVITTLPLVQAQMEDLADDNPLKHVYQEFIREQTKLMMQEWPTTE